MGCDRHDLESGRPNRPIAAAVAGQKDAGDQACGIRRKNGLGGARPIRFCRCAKRREKCRSSKYHGASPSRATAEPRGIRKTQKEAAEKCCLQYVHGPETGRGSAGLAADHVQTGGRGQGTGSDTAEIGFL